MPLSITYAKLRREIGRFLGYGRDPSVWTGDKAYMSTDVEDILEAGLRRFYWPIITVPSKDKDGVILQERYSWSFMSPSATVSLTNGVGDYDLPAGFTDMASETFAYATSAGLPSITRTTGDEILRLRSMAAASAPPTLYSIGVKATSSGAETAYSVSFYPTPATSYTITYSYSVTPPLIDGTNTYPLGGPQNSELVLEACLSEAEKMLDDTDGLHEKRFKELLQAAVAVDRNIDIGSSSDSTWSAANVPTDLTVNRAYLRRLIGRGFGYSPNPGSWSAYEIGMVGSALERGLRRFYWPLAKKLDRDGKEKQERYPWSFLSAAATISATNTDYDYDLPADFTDITSDGLTYASGVTNLPIARVTPEQIAQLRAQSATTGSPKYFAIKAKDNVAGTRTRYEVILSPTPDASYTLNYRYSITPPLLTAETDVPYGGPQHAECIIEACLSEVDSSNGVDGVHEKRFKELLEAEILADRTITERATDSWPVANPATTLKVDRAYLRRLVGRVLGHGPNPSTWDSRETAEVNAAIEAGLRRFYWPSVSRQKYKDGVVTQERYTWSFLSPRATLTVAASAVNLPADFTDMASDGFSYASGLGTSYPRVARVGSEEIASMLAASSTTGIPKYFAIEAKTNSAGTQTAYQAVFCPPPSSSFVLSYAYTITPPALSAEADFPYGGPQHGEVIIEACLAEAEQLMGVDGAHEKRFRELLEGAIEQDKKLSDPDVSDAWDTAATTSSSLPVSKAYLKRLIGRELGYGAHPGLWNLTQSQEVNLALETGLRKFYTPQVLPGEKYNHEWTFLRPLSTFSTVADTYIYALPADFAMLENDQILFAPGSNVIHMPIRLTSERIVMQNHEQSDATGRPCLAAIRPVTMVEANGTRYELVLFPTPDDAYSMTYTYTINPAAISTETALPFGGQPHMQTVIEACLCAVEEMRGKRGVHADAFLTCLRASVSHDRKVYSPDTLGYNSNPRDADNVIGTIHDCSTGVVTYNGIEY